MLLTGAFHMRQIGQRLGENRLRVLSHAAGAGVVQHLDGQPFIGNNLPSRGPDSALRPAAAGRVFAAPLCLLLCSGQIPLAANGVRADIAVRLGGASIPAQAPAAPDCPGSRCDGLALEGLRGICGGHLRGHNALHIVLQA